jgi:hypothetical protein
MEDRAFASATELSNEIRDRRVGCVELFDFYLARAERHNPALNAIVAWQVDAARQRARAAEIFDMIRMLGRLSVRSIVPMPSLRSWPPRLRLRASSPRNYRGGRGYISRSGTTR